VPDVSYTRKAALSTHPDGAFVFSISIATGVTETDETFEWWNVFHGVPNLLTEAQVTGDNPRMVPQCGESNFIERDRKIGVYVVHPENPWA
jgi:hypothetical protein